MTGDHKTRRSWVKLKISCCGDFLDTGSIAKMGIEPASDYRHSLNAKIAPSVPERPPMIGETLSIPHRFAALRNRCTDTGGH